MQRHGDVTVVIPCFNHGRFLLESVASALELHGGPPKVIVVDDGSTDEETASALEALASADGGCDAVVARWWDATTFIDTGGAVSIVGDPPYYVPLAVAFDDHDVRDMHRLLDAVSTIVGDMHDDGTLAALSEKWFEGGDRTIASPPPSPTPSA